MRFGTLVKNGCSEQSKQASLVITDEKTSIIETKLLSLEIVAHRSVKRRRRRRRTKFLSPFLSRWLTRTPPPWKKEGGAGGGGGGGGGSRDVHSPRLLDPYFTADFTLSTTKYARISTHGAILTGLTCPPLPLFFQR